MTSRIPPTESADAEVDIDVVIVGAGLAGLSCARYLAAGGLAVRVFEAEAEVGGRVRTDEVDGFRLDRGFQVLLTAYDEVWRLVDRDRLALGRFEPGSRIWQGGAFHDLPDAFREPGRIGAALRSPVAPLADKLRVARMRSTALMGADLGEPSDDGRRSTLDELRARGFSERFIDGFFRPFLGGVFLDRALSAPASLFQYLFRCFASGDATIPAGGMGRLPEAIAEPLGDAVTTGIRVRAVGPDSVELENGSRVRARRVVIATEAAAAAALTGEASPSSTRAVTAWFAARTAPIERPVLLLDGAGEGPVNHLAVVTEVAEGLAPEGWSLVAASGSEPFTGPVETFVPRALEQMKRWFGADVERWGHLKTHEIPHALPSVDRSSAPTPGFRVGSDGIVRVGDHEAFAAIQGALRSGRRAAEWILAEESD
ncbi:MAG: FAD-dependent oxidoreductase [Gemmatimonadetes bacterium]|nr:FAD-dependent oxidoreductase [Gemmatimonadota bacterium]